MLAELVRLGFLITSLRPAMTTTDALGHVTGELRAAGAHEIPETAGLLEQLEELQRDLAVHNAAEPEHQAAMRERLSAAVTEISAEGRTPLCLDLRLDAEVTLPEPVGREMAAAASALIRLSPNPGGSPVWEDYHRRFTERFGTATLVPLLDVINPAIGLGYPAGYPASVLPLPPERDAGRHAHLAQLITGESEVTLTDELIDTMTGSLFDPRLVPAHVEIAARVQAASTADLDAGRYTLHISPARAAGTLTSRFSALAAGSGLERRLPQRACRPRRTRCPVQLSVPPLFIRGENVGRIPAYLPGLLSLGEHPGRGDKPLGPDDLAVTATLRGLHLVHRETGQVIEPQVFHPLDLEKQMPPLGRFLAHLPRAFAADYLAFDWGPFRRLPHLPAVRYRRSVLSPEQWRLTAGSLPPAHAGLAEWRRSLAAWRRAHRLPGRRPAAQRRPDAAPGPGRAAARAVPARARGRRQARDHDPGTGAGGLRLDRRPRARDRPPAHPARRSRPGRDAPSAWSASQAAGHRPAAAGRGLGVAERQAVHGAGRDGRDHRRVIFPALIASLGTDEVWFIRYRNREETDHLRVRIAAGHGQAARRAAALAAWAGDLRARRLCARVALDTYYPEAGRYGDGECHARGRGRVRRRLRRGHRAAPAAARDRSRGADRARHARHRRRLQRRPGTGHAVAGRPAPAAGQGRRPRHGPDRHHARAQRGAEQLRHAARRPRPCLAPARRGRGGLPQDPGRGRGLHPHPRIPPAHPPQPLPGDRPRRRGSLPPARPPGRPRPARRLSPGDRVTSTSATPAGWHQDLGRGAAGTALARIAAARLTGLPPRATAPWIRAMTAGPVTANASASLFYGAPAVAFVLHTGAHPAYAAMLAALDEHVNDLTALKLAAAYERIDRGELTRPGEYDLISGLTGLGVYHLVRHGSAGSGMTAAVLGYLVALAEPVRQARRVPARLVERHRPRGHARPGLAGRAPEPRHGTRHRRHPRTTIGRDESRHPGRRPGQGGQRAVRDLRPLPPGQRRLPLVARDDHPQRAQTREGELRTPGPAVLVLRHPRPGAGTAARGPRARRPGTDARRRARSRRLRP